MQMKNYYYYYIHINNNNNNNNNDDDDDDDDDDDNNNNNNNLFTDQSWTQLGSRLKLLCAATNLHRPILWRSCSTSIKLGMNQL